jgi:3-oxoadipate enol-lactonase
MKVISTIFMIIFGAMQITAQSTENKMDTKIIKTKIGDIAANLKVGNAEKTPLIFLHGVYFDHHLWDSQINEINDRIVITIDMPWHGGSTENIIENWSLNDCGEMLLEILDSLQISKVIAIGHSWGSMNILRAASKQPERFASIGFCNMPFEAVSTSKKVTFRFQHLVVGLKDFYIKQASKSLFHKESLAKRPHLQTELHRSMSKLTAKQIRQIDKFVILEATNTSALISSLKVPAIALKGEHDYVPTPPVETTIVPGGHVSPLEQPDLVLNFCKKVIAKSATNSLRTNKD